MTLTDLDALTLSGRLAERSVSAVEVMAAYLDRIERLNPGLNAIVSLRPRDELMAEAQAADRAPRRGWLHGMPLAVKDLEATAGILSTSGSPMFADLVPSRDDLLPARLKAAGAILIGKTNVPEFGLGSHTYNPVFGPTRNPWDRSRTPGGSSGGAAAALSAHLLPVADGSDAMGSLRNPAGFCNIYSLRPTVGLVPAEPQGEMFFGALSTEGPMGRTPADVAALLGTLAGPDPRRPFGRPVEDWLGQIDAELSGRRIGWLGDWGGALPFEPGIQDLCASALARVRGAGRPRRTRRPALPAGESLGELDHPALVVGRRPSCRDLRRSGETGAAETGADLGDRARDDAECRADLGGERGAVGSVSIAGENVPNVRCAGAADGAGLAVPGRMDLAAGHRRNADGYLSPLDGSGGSGQPDRPAGDDGSRRFWRAGPADGAADLRPRRLRDRPAATGAGLAWHRRLGPPATATGVTAGRCRGIAAC